MKRERGQPFNLRTGARYLSVACHWVAGAAFAIAAVVLFVQVVLRYIFLYSLPWAEELARYLGAYLALLGSAAVMYDDNHPALEIILDRFSGRPRVVLDMAIWALTIAFLAVLLWQGIDLVEFGMLGKTAALRIPKGYAYLAIPLGAGAMLIQAIIRAAERASDLRRQGKEA